MADDLILAVNAGSSTIKFGAFRLPSLARVAFGHVDALGSDDCAFRAEAAGEPHSQELPGADHERAMAALVAWIGEALGGAKIAACSHRIVHGGPDHVWPLLADGAVVRELEAFIPLAPLHQPHNLAGMVALARALPGTPQVACFDTAFHRDHPKVAEVYALPREMTEAGVRRYGFHGLSYEYIARRLRNLDPELASGRVIVAHLGAGASLCAMRDGRSVDSTMGFTALDGLPMATRTGQLDPGVVLHLWREGRPLAEGERMLYRDSGLKGLSGLSGDMRELQAAGTPAAAFAIEYFCYRVAREIGALAVSLGGLDGLVFTAGVGENAPAIRADICSRLGLLGAVADEAANAAGAERFDADGSRIRLLRLPTDEEKMLAIHAARCIGAPVGAS